MSYYTQVAPQRSMAFDKTRNAQYLRAIHQLVDSNTTVLDLGSGVGVLGLAAAQAGARHVYLVDNEPTVHLASAAARASGLADRVTVIQADAATLQLPERVDLILSVFTGNFLLEEDLLPLLFKARDRFLAPGGRLLPDRGKMRLAPVSMPAYYAEHIEAWDSRQHQLDYSAGRRHAVNSAFYDQAEDMQPTLLAEPVDLLELDFHAAERAECVQTVPLQFTRDGHCHGLLGWFDMRLGDAWLSTSPLAEPTHWRQVFLPLDAPLAVRAGDAATATIRRPQYGDWAWTFELEAHRETHSTFLATPVAKDTLARQTGAYQPSLTHRGQAAQQVLSDMARGLSIDAMTERVLASAPEVFDDPADAGRFVRSLCRRYGD